MIEVWEIIWGDKETELYIISKIHHIEMNNMYGM